MTIQRVLATFLIMGVAFAAIGAALGATLGAIAPGYYRTVFHAEAMPNFNPFEVGLGLGTTQGLGAGIVVALLVLALQYWTELRKADPSTSFGESANLNRFWARFAIWGMFTVAIIGMASSFAFIAGTVVGQSHFHASIRDQKLSKIALILDSHQFPNVSIMDSSSFVVCLTGAVETEEARSALRDKLVLAFGEDEANAIISPVRVGN